MQIKLAFKLNEKLPDTNNMYTMDFLVPLDEFIDNNGIVTSYSEHRPPEYKYTKEDIIGLVSSYTILKSGYIILNASIINERYNALKNVENYLIGLPKVEGIIDDVGIIRVKKINNIEVVI